jgi:hypothetical protein
VYIPIRPFRLSPVATQTRHLRDSALEAKVAPTLLYGLALLVWSARVDESALQIVLAVAHCQLVISNFMGSTHA